jgi:hypothetical protein
MLLAVDMSLDVRVGAMGVGVWPFMCMCVHFPSMIYAILIGRRGINGFLNFQQVHGSTTNKKNMF